MKTMAAFFALAIMPLACDDKGGEMQVKRVDAEYSLDFSDPAGRAFVPGDVLELEIVNHDKDGHATAVDRDVTCSVDVPVNLQEYVNTYNEKYASDCLPLATTYYSTVSGVMRKGENRTSVSIRINGKMIAAAQSPNAFVLPVSIKSDYAGLASHDIKYIVVPSYTTKSNGNIVAHFSRSDAWLEVFNAALKTDKAILFTPGGGYSSIGYSDSTEFKGRNITFANLVYRLPKDSMHGRHDLVLQDASDALDILWEKASSWGGYTQVGTMGRSAGAHLAGANAACHKDKVNFEILLYPVISMDISRTHEGSVYYFLGIFRSQELVDAFSLEKLVTKDTPRTYIAYSMDDNVVPQLYNGVEMVKSLSAAGVEYVEKKHATGGHSTGSWPEYPAALYEWLGTF